MYTQLFGNYLLSKGHVTSEQLIESIQYAKDVHLKLGVLAIHAGYMTSGEVDEIHIMQTHVDRRFGELAVEQGFLRPAQLEDLLKGQRPGYLLLGQALIEKNHLTNQEFETILSSYQSEFKVMNGNSIDEQQERIPDILKNFYQSSFLGEKDSYMEYIALLFNNIIRFVGEDFTPFKGKEVSSYSSDFCVSQQVQGKYPAYTAIDMDEETYIRFASRYAAEDFFVNDEYVEASIADFLNLHNGLFAVVMSNENSIELSLTPPVAEHHQDLPLIGDTLCIPITFSFGKINFLLSIR